LSEILSFHLHFTEYQRKSDMQRNILNRHSLQQEAFIRALLNISEKDPNADVQQIPIQVIDSLQKNDQMKAISASLSSEKRLNNFHLNVPETYRASSGCAAFGADRHPIVPETLVH
jgi:hypothetical protein